MTFPKARVVVSGLLFVAWLSYLGYLVAVTRDTIVLSRPQIIVSDLCVLAKLEERDGRPAPEAQVTRVLSGPDDAKALQGKMLTIAEKSLAKIDKDSGWSGPGEYLLPLKVLDNQEGYEVTPLPRAPEFPAGPPHVRIYRATDDVLRQFHELKPGN